jgi:hypothetical protein
MTHRSRLNDTIESSRPKKTSSTEKVEETGQNEPVPYEFTLPRFKKRQHREEDEDENADYAEKHREELRNELAELEASTKQVDELWLPDHGY